MRAQSASHLQRFTFLCVSMWLYNLVDKLYVCTLYRFLVKINIQFTWTLMGIYKWPKGSLMQNGRSHLIEIKEASNSQRSTSHYFTWATTPTFSALIPPWTQTMCCHTTMHNTNQMAYRPTPNINKVNMGPLMLIHLLLLHDCKNHYFNSICSCHSNVWHSRRQDLHRNFSL